MKVRKLAVALALAGGLGSGVAQALGLGEIELQSYLNEPFEADIGLTRSEGVSPAEVFVNLASDDAYRRVGIDRNYFLTKLKFNVATASDGSLVVNVTTTEPVKEPYLNFLLEVTWPNGRLMREYAVLVDPPVYAEDSGVTEQVQAPVARPAPQPVQAQSEAPRQAPAPRPVAESAPATVEASSPSRDTFGPTGPSDTLWGIASSVRPDDSVTTQQVMLAIQDLNPDAFIDGNINRLKRGQVLRVPSVDQIQSRTRAQANQEVTLQNQSLATSTRAVDARSESSPEPSVASAAPSEPTGDELKLLVADAGSEPESQETGSAGGDSQLAGGVDSGTAVAMEELESTRRENEELTGRVDDLQSQVETLQRLLELKNTQLAEFEQGLTQDDDTQSVGEGVATDASEPMAEAAVPAEAGMANAEPAMDDGAPEEGVVADEPVTDRAMADQQSGDVPPVPENESGVIESDQAGDDVQAESAPEPAAEGATATVATPAAQPEPKPATPPAQPVAEKGFPGNIIDLITQNPLYQIALGGGLVLLLLLLLLVARRNASKEKAFYEQLNSEEDDGEILDLQDDNEEALADGEEATDPMAEADTYIAYGRLDQASQTLESAISREPSRTDLRIKLLGVYADAEDRNSFEKQFGELEALDDEAATAEAQLLRSRLEEAEAAPSIDDLESQLMSDSFATDAAEPEISDSAESSPEAVAETEELAVDFGDLDFSSSADETAETEIKPAIDIEEPAEEEAGGEALIEFDLSDVDMGEGEDDAKAESSAESVKDDLGLNFDVETVEEEEAGFDLEDLDDALDLGGDLSGEPEAEAPAQDDEFASLELDEDSLEDSLESLTEESTGEEVLPELDEAAGDDGSLASGGLDESFLDELDAELDKVAGSAEESLPEESADDGLAGLELDISDEDLALMGEVADSGDQSVDDLNETPLDEDLGLEDTLQNSGQEPAAEDVPIAEEEVPVAEEAIEERSVTGTADSGITEINESELGDDDDFDFLAGTDEAATKLDLARAYIEMGDADGARDILEEVSIEGSDQQKAEAQDLLKSLS